MEGDKHQTVIPFGVMDIVIDWETGPAGGVPLVRRHSCVDRRTGLVHYLKDSTNGTAQRHYEEARQVAANVMRIGSRFLVY